MMNWVKNGKFHLLGLLVIASAMASSNVKAESMPLLPVTRIISEEPLTQILSEELESLILNIEEIESSILNIPVNKALYIEFSYDVYDVVIADPTIADVVVKKQNLLFVFGLNIGSTVVYFLDKYGLVISQTEVRVQLDTAAIDDAIKHILPDADAQLSSHGSSLFLTGNVDSAGEATIVEDLVRSLSEAGTDITNLLKIRESQQVLIKVRVAEVERSVRKHLAVSQPITSGLGNLAVSAINPFGAVATDFFAAGAVRIGSLRSGGGSNILSLGDATFRALEENGLVKTLAEPSLTAISGETAQFLAGGEFPTPTGTDNNGNITIEFKNFGIALNFTPVVLDGGTINLQIATEVSAVDVSNGITLLNGIFIPGIKTNRTSSTVQLSSGGTLILSGLIQNEEANNIQGIPYLKDVPILGALFRSTRWQQNSTELLIIVSAYIAKPVSGGETTISLPTDGYPPPNDFDLYLLGKLNGKYLNSDEPLTKNSLAGPFGYIME